QKSRACSLTPKSRGAFNRAFRPARGRPPTKTARDADEATLRDAATELPPVVRTPAVVRAVASPQLHSSGPCREVARGRSVPVVARRVVGFAGQGPDAGRHSPPPGRVARAARDVRQNEAARQGARRLTQFGEIAH